MDSFILNETVNTSKYAHSVKCHEISQIKKIGSWKQQQQLFSFEF